MRSVKVLIALGVVSLLFLAGCRSYHKLQKDVPVYSGARFIKLFEDSSNKKKKHELWAVDASISDIAEFYKSELVCLKWKQEMVAPSPDGNGTALAYTKKDQMLIVIVYAKAGQENQAYIDFSIASLSR